MKDMTIADKMEKHGKPSRQHGPITLKGISGVINRALRRARGTRDNTHSKIGVLRRLLPQTQLHTSPPDLPHLLTGVTFLKRLTALLNYLMQPSSHRLRGRLRGCPHPALDKTLVCPRVHLAGKIGAQRPWLTADSTLHPQANPRPDTATVHPQANPRQDTATVHLRPNPRQDTASKVASPSLATTPTSHSSIGMKLPRRPSARCLTRS